MISVIITAWKEPVSVKKAVTALKKQLSKKDEVLVFCPDKETATAAESVGAKAFDDLGGKEFKEGRGKPAALNSAIKKAKGDILVLTDGDVFVGENSLAPLLEPFKDSKTGAVGGHPVSRDPRNKMFGFWAHVLTSVAHERRLTALANKKRFFCSGYFFAVRKSLFPKLDKELLSEDGFVSHCVYEKGYKLEYSPEAKVYVKYPANLPDWIKQKKRSAGGYNQIKKMLGTDIRSLKRETLGGLGLLKFITGPKEFFWLMLLFFARLYLWILIYIDINIKEKKHKDIWVRVESTK